MYTIINNVENIYIEKNSKFIGLIIKVNSNTEVNNYLEKTKEKYKDATHYCYAYIINNEKKCSDDREPSNTAGLPILNVLEKKKLNHVLCIVIRYFGGIKLGTGGLVRAYTKSVTNCIESSNLKIEEEGFDINIIFTYDDIKEIDYILIDSVIINKEFNDKIKYNVLIKKEKLDKIKTINNIEIIINSKIII